MIATAILTALFAALGCDLDQARFVRTPDGATTNGTLQAKDVPGAVAYSNATKRLTGGVCAAMYGLREAEIMRKVFPLATGDIAGWGALQNEMPDLTAFDLCPTNYADETYSEKPEYRYYVTPSGTRCLSWTDAEFGSVWNANGGAWTDTNHVAKTGAWDLITPPESNRVFRTTRLTAYLKRVVDMPIDALRGGTWQKMGSWNGDGNGCWLDPTLDHASFVTGAWCKDGSSGIVSDYSKFLKSLTEYRNDIDATQSVTRASTAFGGENVWKQLCVNETFDSMLESCGYPTAKAEFEKAVGERSTGKISDMIALAAPGLKASVTSDWQKAVQKIAASATTRLWWQRQALANGIVSLHSQVYSPLTCFTSVKPTEALPLPEDRLNLINGEERYIQGSAGKTEGYEIPTDAITVGNVENADGKGHKGWVAFVDASKLNVTNSVVTDAIDEGTWDVYGHETHCAYWKHSNPGFSVGLYAIRWLTGADVDYCLPTNETPVINFKTLSPSESHEVPLENFELRYEINSLGEYEFRIYVAKDDPLHGGELVQTLHVPTDKWAGYGEGAYSATVDGRAYWSSDAPGTWKPLTKAAASGETQNPIALVTAGSKLADMVKADVLLWEGAFAGTNAYEVGTRYKDDEDGEKNSWIFTRLSNPFKDVVPHMDTMKEISNCVNGADKVKSRMVEVLDQMPGLDPFDFSKARSDDLRLVPWVEELFPKTRKLPSPFDQTIPWYVDERGYTSTAWVYILECDKDGVTTARWAGKNTGNVTAIICGTTDGTAKPSRHSKWIQYESNAGWILKFTFPFMNFDSSSSKEAK